MTPAQQASRVDLALTVAPSSDQAETGDSLVARFEQVVARYSERVAVETATERVTYAALNRQINRIAFGLLDRAGSVAEPIALLMAHDTPLIAATMAVRKAGQILSVLDPDHPPAFLRALLDDLDTRWLVTDEAHLELAQAIAPDKCQVELVDAMAIGDGETNPEVMVRADAPGTIVYTSGSTGRPKGVVYPHASHYIVQPDNDVPGVQRHDRLALFAPLASGSPRGDLLTGLLRGATLFPFNPRYHSVDDLSEWLIRHRITVLRPPLGLMRQWLGSLEAGQIFPDLRLVTLIGDFLYRQDVLRLRQHVLPHCQFIHRYGSSEAGGITRGLIDPDRALEGDSVPVGYPAPGCEVLILDEERRPVPAGEVGEIVVRSRTMALGYWRRPTLTAERFVDDPSHPGLRLCFTGDFGRFLPDGQLALTGRRDAQVKIRGYRVGLGTIESALLDVPVVSEAAVFAQPGPADEKRIVAYVVLKDKAYPLDHLRQALAAVLPDYAVPSAFVTLDALPLTANGKVDRHALPPLDRQRPALATPFVAPCTATETHLVSIWRDVLGVEGIGVHDRFADLGGDSLLASQVINRVHRAFQVPIPVRVLLQAATIADMATMVDTARGAGLTQRLPGLVAEVEELSEAEAERLLSEGESQ